MLGVSGEAEFAALGRTFCHLNNSPALKPFSAVDYSHAERFDVKMRIILEEGILKAIDGRGQVRKAR